MIRINVNCLTGKPHNPFINAGAIIVTSLLKMGHKMADRYDFVSYVHPAIKHCRLFLAEWYNHYYVIALQCYSYSRTASMFWGEKFIFMH